MLIAALYASNAGLQAASTFLDVVGNNITNSDTTGYKTGQVTFQDLLYTGQKPGAVNNGGSTIPAGTQLGSGAVVDAVTGKFTQGSITPTGAPLDFAVSGEGFFRVTLADGTTGYTRAGNFTTDVNGTIVTDDGFKLAGGINIPVNTSSVSLGADGTLTATTPTGTVPIGTLTLTRFQNPGGLTRIGNTTFTAGPAAGTAITSAPGTNGNGTVTQGSLEQSNVDIATELVNLLVAQRAFQFNTQAVQVESETLQSTFALIP